MLSFCKYLIFQPIVQNKRIKGIKSGVKQGVHLNWKLNTDTCILIKYKWTWSQNVTLRWRSKVLKFYILSACKDTLCLFFLKMNLSKDLPNNFSWKIPLPHKSTIDLNFSNGCPCKYYSNENTGIPYKD